MSCTAASIVVNLHREGLLLAPTLRSILHARARARAAGLALELVAVADRPDEATLAVLASFGDEIDRRLEVDFGDLGRSRPYGIAAASHDWVFMHDGDDLFSSNWYEAFFRAAAEGRIDERTVYHTEIFARFGELYDLRRLVASDDPRFHPFFLASEWYYSNKAVLNRRLLAEFPLPQNSIRTGIGNEDWTWSCDTIHGGVRHGLLPETACFYRVKPAAKSLGLTPGMIHGPSPLFDPDNVAALTRTRGATQPMLGGFSSLSTGVAEPRIGEAPIPHWFWAEVRRQGEFESLITEFLMQEPVRQNIPLPNLHYNVVSATEYLFDGLDARPKLFLFVSMGNFRAADATVELLLRAAAEYDDRRWQPVLVVDDRGHLFSEARTAAVSGAKVVSVQRLRDEFEIAFWYFQRFLMRPLVQFPGSLVLDFGSQVFADLFAQFHRALLSTSAQVRMVFLEDAADPLSPALACIMRNAAAWRSHARGPVPVTLRPEAAALFRDPGPWRCTILGEEVTALLDRAGQGRFAATEFAGRLDLGRLLAPGDAAGARPPVPLPGGFRAECARLGEVERIILRDPSGSRHVYRSTDAW
ncbi:MAG TPA: glycosyltransferase family A protein, partial [Paracoccaceae bacterium]|nr:glycosyltransferase family A protein [Paracoccaceae bacterium]